ncbi:MAG: 30S ribosomal protein S6 [Desulfobacterales bacterium]|nr:30S ribosomal protein S6 [Desulfobacterales bacterium]
MRKYETVFISDPDLQDQAREELFDKVRNIITRENGILLDFDEWGSKKLAYEIKKKLRGYYVCLTYGGTGDLVTELERNFRLSDDIMKFMTILLSDNVTAESLEKEVAEAKAAEEAEKAVEEPAEEDAPAEEASEEAAEEPAEPVEETADAGETKE